MDPMNLKEGQTFKAVKRIPVANGTVFKKGEELVFSHWHHVPSLGGRVNVFFGEGDKHVSFPARWTKLEDFMTEVK